MKSLNTTPEQVTNLQSLSETHHSCEVVMNRADTWVRISSSVCNSKADRRGRVKRLAGGLWG